MLWKSVYSRLTCISSTVIPIHLGFQTNSSRLISTSIRLCRGNQRKPRVLTPSTGSSDKSKSRRDSARELLASTNRSKWEKENALLSQLIGRVPNSSAYLISEFEPKQYSLNEAVECLREGAQTDMYDCMDNALHIKVIINMCTKKKTKFIPKFESHVVLPNLLDFLPKNRVLAICQDTDDRESLLSKGALDVGGLDLIDRIEHGAFHWEEYDTVVAHTRWEPNLSKLRHVLKDRIPTIKNGRLGDNMEQLIVTYCNGTALTSTPLEGVPEVAFVDLILGQLSWDMDRLEKNLRVYLENMELVKSSRTDGNLIKSVELYCPPTGEKFLLNKSYFTEVIMPTTKQIDEEESDEHTSLLSTSL